MLFIEILKSILFGIVEGITEWLPVSSTGHMILLNEFLRLDVSPEFYEMFEVVIQLGAILAVIVLFFGKLNPFAPSKTAEQKKGTWSLWFKVVAAVIPSAVIGFLLDDWFNEHFYNYVTVAVALVVYGVAFILIERFKKPCEVRVDSVDSITYKDALLVGAFQVLAIIPGTSRSGSTILGGMLFGLSRTAAAEFSFFLAIPTMLGASLLKALKFFASGASVSLNEWIILAVGCAVAFAVSMLVIRFLMDFVKRHSFSAFGVYRIVLGIAVVLYFLVSR